jgi:ferrous iron transport protein A
MSQSALKFLSGLAHGDSAVLDGFAMEDALAERLMMMGFLPGATVEVVGASPFGDPRIYRVDGCDIALRRETALQVRVRSRS